MGRNNIADPPSKLLDTVRDLDLMIAHMTGTPKRYIVLGVIPSSTELNNTSRWIEIANLNAYLAARYKSRFLDVAAHLRTVGLAQVGLGPTPTDATDIANGLVPTALKADSIHLNDLGKQAVARLVARTIANEGWVPGALPVPELPSTAMITSDSFNRADSSVGALGTSDAAFGGTGATWTGTGEVKIKNNTLTRDTATAIRYAYISAGQADHRISAKLLALPAGAGLSGLIGRRSDASNFYGAYVSSNGSIQLSKTLAGSSSGLMGPSPAGVYTPGQTLEFRVSGSVLTALVDGVVVLSRTDPSNPLATGNECGCRFPTSEVACAYDDVRVWAA